MVLWNFQGFRVLDTFQEILGLGGTYFPVGMEGVNGIHHSRIQSILVSTLTFGHPGTPYTFVPGRTKRFSTYTSSWCHLPIADEHS